MSLITQRPEPGLEGRLCRGQAGRNPGERGKARGTPGGGMQAQRAGALGPRADPDKPLHPRPPFSLLGKVKARPLLNLFFMCGEGGRHRNS